MVCCWSPVAKYGVTMMKVEGATTEAAACSKGVIAPKGLKKNCQEIVKMFEKQLTFDIQVRLGHVWGHTPEQRVAASNLRRYFFGFRLVIARADARPVMPVSLEHPTGVQIRIWLASESPF